MVPQLPGHDWPRSEHIPPNTSSCPAALTLHGDINGDFKPRARVGGLGYLPRQDAVFKGSSGSLASGTSEPLSSRGSSTHLMPYSPGGDSPRDCHQLHGSVPNLPAGHPSEGRMALRHHSQPLLYYNEQQREEAERQGASAAAAAAALNPTTILVPPPPPPPSDHHHHHRYSPHSSGYYAQHDLESPVQPDMPLTTFSIGGDDDDDDDEDSDGDGSDQDLLNPNTVFAPREDGAPESYHATDPGPRPLDEDEDDEDKENGPVTLNSVHLVENPEGCNAEIQDSMYPTEIEASLSSSPSSGTSSSSSLGTKHSNRRTASPTPTTTTAINALRPETETPGTVGLDALCQLPPTPAACTAAEASAAEAALLTNCSLRGEDSEDISSNHNTQVPCDGGPNCGDNSQTLPLRDSEGPLAQHATSSPSMPSNNNNNNPQPTTANIPATSTSRATPTRTPSPPPYEDTAFYPDTSPPETPSQEALPPVVAIRVGDMDTNMPSSSPSKVNLNPQSITPSQQQPAAPNSPPEGGKDIGCRSTTAAAAEDSPKAVSKSPAHAASDAAIPNAIVIDETNMGDVRHSGGLAPTTSTTDNRRHLQEEGAEDLARSTEEYV